jgi:hypothetical protein
MAEGMAFGTILTPRFKTVAIACGKEEPQRQKKKKRSLKHVLF